MEPIILPRVFSYNLMDTTTTPRLIGHEKNKTVLTRLYDEGFVTGSYLFTGTEAVGKKMTALWFARLVNCTGEAPPCGNCLSCRKILQGIHPDVRVITREEEKTVITIDQVRQQVIDEANYKPFEGKYRVFIIDDAHMLNDQAQNALLKTLEEPGQSIIIILVTSRPSELLPTIISRCRELRFLPLPAKDIEAILKEDPDVAFDRIPLLVSFAGGAPGKALSLASDTDFWKDRDKLFAILEKLPDGKLEDILEFCESLKISRTEIKALESLFEILLSWLRDISFLRSGMDSSTLVNSDYFRNLEGIAYCFTPEDILLLQELTLEQRKLVFENNLNLKLALQRLFIRIKQAGTVKM